MYNGGTAVVVYDGRGRAGTFTSISCKEISDVSCVTDTMITLYTNINTRAIRWNVSPINP